MRLILPVALALVALGCGDPQLDEADEALAVAQLFQRAELRATLQDPGDLRPEALRILAEIKAHRWGRTMPGGLNQLAFNGPPKQIKVWRRSFNKANKDSCKGTIQTFNMEDYVKGVLPSEWIRSWPMETQKAGAVAIRSYASYWVSKGGKYNCADLCDTTYSQVYKDARYPNTSQAVDATKNQVVLKGGKLASTEYSAENTVYPTWGGVKVNDTTTCTGKAKFGHGRGMCQWGSMRWAKYHSKGYTWIVNHYYPGGSLWKPTAPKLDKGVPPKLDKGVPPKLDKGAPPKLDKGVPPKQDKGVPPKQDKGTKPPPKLDSGTKPPPKKDRGGTPPRMDGGPLPPSYQQQALTLQGGCAVLARGPGAADPTWLLLLPALLWWRRRRLQV